MRAVCFYFDNIALSGGDRSNRVETVVSKFPVEDPVHNAPLDYATNECFATNICFYKRLWEKTRLENAILLFFFL